MQRLTHAYMDPASLQRHVDHPLTALSDWLRVNVHVNPMWALKSPEKNCATAAPAS